MSDVFFDSARKAFNQSTTRCNVVVPEDYKLLPTSSNFYSPLIVYSPCEDIYRSDILSKNLTPEYSIWSLCNSDLTSSSLFTYTDAIGSIPTGKYSVQNGLTTSPDGSNFIFLADSKSRTIKSILSLSIRRGDNNNLIVLTPNDLELDLYNNRVTILNTVTTQLLGVVVGNPPCVSNLRGDNIEAVEYRVEDAQFSWSKNEATRKRVEWNNLSQRWEPLKGSSPILVGEIKENKTYSLSMVPEATLHTFLSGDTLYAQIRVGTEPDDDSILLNEPEGVYVISDDELETFDFSSQPTAVAALALPSGVLLFESTFSQTNTGMNIWLDRPRFGESTGLVKRMIDGITENLYISPIPIPGEIPILRFGSRKPLTVVPSFSDTELALITPLLGECAFSYSSGKLKFNLIDLQRSDPSSPNFETSYLLESIFYDGVQLNLDKCELRLPTRLLDASGSPSLIGNDLFIPNADLYNNPCISGVLHILDKTGSVPTSGTPTARPGGDNLGDISTGLVRSLGAEALLFSKSKVFVINLVNNDLELPVSTKIPSGEVYISLQKSTYGSRVRFSSVDIQKYATEFPIFLQPIVTPYSVRKLSDYYVSDYIPSTVTFPDLTPIDFYIDGVNYIWTPPQASMTLEDVVTDLNTLIGISIVSTFRNRLLISVLNSIEFSPTSTNSSFLGFNPFFNFDSLQNKELSYTSGISFEFLKDFQMDLDFYRTKSYDTLLTSKIIDTNIVLLTTIPLRDRNGLDYDTFFSVSDGIQNRSLSNFEDLYYDFVNSRLRWLNIKSEVGVITDLISFLKLQSTQLTEFSFLNILGNYFKLSNGSNFTDLIQDVDFKFLSGGITGTLVFTEGVAPTVVQGQQGYANINTNLFTDLSGMNFLVEGVQAEQFLVTDDSAYLISSVSSNQLQIEGTFESVFRGSWKVLDFSSSTYDPGILADVVWEDFQHLPEEPFNINVFSPCGLMPISVPLQLLNRRSCFISEALVNQRSFWLSYGLDSSLISVHLLVSLELGNVANGLFLQLVGTDRYTTQSFSVVLGSNVYTHTSGLLPVVSFSPVLASNTIEYLIATGEMRFASNVLENFSGITAFQREEFLPAINLNAGFSEVDSDGLLNISSADITSNQGKEVYFVERYIVKNRLDVTVSPLSGSVGFRKPLKEGQIVQAAYFPADLSGDVLRDSQNNIITIIEFLPIFVSLEVATRSTAFIYTFNPTGKTVDPDAQIVVYVGAKRQNFANNKDYIISENTIRFNSEIPANSIVKISYAVLNCFGGETTFEVSTKPVYRKPFFLLKDQNTFNLVTDRSPDLVPGKILNVGTEVFYIKSSIYSPSTDLTTITIFPTPIEEAGSRTPGQVVNNRLTSRPLATDVDGISISGNAGFWSSISDSFDPIRKNQTTIRIHNPSVFFAKANHLLEIDGIPYLIKSSKVIDNRYTDIELTSLTMDETVTGTLKISVRPIFEDSSTRIQNYFPIYSEDPYTLIHYNHDTNSGTVLRSGLDYRLDLNNGNIEIINLDYIVGPEISIRSSYTKIDVQGPIDFNGAVLYPRYKARYSQYALPSEMTPPCLGLFLRLKAEVYSPDVFFVTIRNIEEISSQIESTVIAASTDVTNEILLPSLTRDRGILGNDSFSSILIKDRVARENISNLNDLTNSFDQILEMFDCTFIGNSDGYFNFFLGKNNRYTPPGYQNDITGELNSRNIFIEYLEGEITRLTGLNLYLSENDYLYEINGSLNLSSGVISGDSMSMQTFNRSRLNQRERNDIDDLTSDGKSKAVLLYQGGNRVYLNKGVFVALGLSSLSRFFPKQGSFYLTTTPGIGDPYPGVYTYARNIDGVVQSTYQNVIGNISNNTLEKIGYLQSLTISKRYPRFRIYGYSENGYPVLVISTDGIPAMILSAVILENFPVDFTGVIDTSKFLSLGGDLPDIVTGITDISLPGVRVGDPVIYGTENGVYSVFDSNFPYFVEGELKYAPVFINSVDVGCVITFRDSDGNIITDANRLIVPNGTIYEIWNPQQGDTLLSGAVTSITQSLSDPMTTEEKNELLALSPTFNIGFDVGVNMETGELIDITKPSYADGINFPLKEISGQNPPVPLQDLEGTYFCADTRTDIVSFPSLSGEDKNDSGDYQYPYIDRGNYEKKYLRDLHNLVLDLSGDSYLPDAKFPFELEGNGTVDSLCRFQTSVNLLPVSGPYIPNSGLADARGYDLVFFRLSGSSTVPTGMQGISCVGDVFEESGSYYLRTPRFVTPTTQGTRIRYTATNIIHFTGLSIQDDGVQTTISIPSSLNLYFNDGTVGNQGGLNWILDHISNPFGSNENSVTFRIIHPISGLITQEIEITGDAGLGQGRVTSGLGTVNFLTAPVISQFSIIIPATGFVDPSLYSGSFPGTIGPFEFTVSIDTYSLGVSGLLANKGSFTGYIADNRISFRESYDLRNIPLEGTLTPGNQSIQAALNVYHVTGKYSESITVNAGSVINSLAPFLFLETGTFDIASSSGAGDELGNSDVPSFREFGNISASGSADFTVLATTNNNSTSPILDGEGTCEGSTFQDHQVVVLSVNNGATENVKSGDILCITESSDATIDGGAAPTFSGKASVKCGSYIVRSVVSSDDFGVNPKFRKLIVESKFGSSSGWVSSPFPSITAFSESSNSITVNTLNPFNSPTIIDSPTGHAFPSTGRIFILLNLNNMNSPSTDANFALSIYSAAYTSIVGTSFLGISDWRDGRGSPITEPEFYLQVAIGKPISGMVYLPIQMENKNGLPSREVVGFSDVNTYNGFSYITYEGNNGSIVFDASLGEIDSFPSGAGTLGIKDKTKSSSTNFLSYEDCVYDRVPGLLDLSQLTSGQWTTLHDPGLPVTLVNSLSISCILPVDNLATKNGVTEGFKAKAAIFLEPSVPIFPYNLGSGYAHVVDAGHTLLLSDISMKTSSIYGVSSPGSTDYIKFEIRRVRRFNEVDTTIPDILRSCFEIRRGIIGGYSQDNLQRGILTSSGTQFGDFNNSISTIKEGDLFRLVDSDNNLLEEVEILSVLDGNNLLLSSPGIISIGNPVGYAFEIYKKGHLIPHEQSLEVMMEKSTTKIYESIADFENEEGAYVSLNIDYDNSINILRDTNITGIGSNSFIAKGIEVGDYLVIDPQGDITFVGAPSPLERGDSPLGDNSVIGRANYVAGSVSNLDDNRGVYKVLEVNSDNLVVSSTTIFTGDLVTDIIFENATVNAYAVYPTVNSSGLSGSGREGQNDLRPTDYRVGNSYATNNYSIAPFTYRIFRATGIISDDTLQLILTQRERVKSFIQKLAYELHLGYRYWDLQNLEYLSNWEEGLPITQQVQEELLGDILTTPYSNSRTCLSLLDRRFWIKDLTLEGTYSNFSAGIGTPVLPDRLLSSINFEEPLRKNREAWINYRISKPSGTLRILKSLKEDRQSLESKRKTQIKLKR